MDDMVPAVVSAVEQLYKDGIEPVDIAVRERLGLDYISSAQVALDDARDRGLVASLPSFYFMKFKAFDYIDRYPRSAEMYFPLDAKPEYVIDAHVACEMMDFFGANSDVFSTRMPPEKTVNPWKCEKGDVKRMIRGLDPMYKKIFPELPDY